MGKESPANGGNLSKSKKMKRALEFDGIRAVAILFIVLCHICFGMGWAATGRFCANTFNTVFFLLSALLLGLNINKYKLGGVNSSSCNSYQNGLCDCYVRYGLC